jgi:hypothetical protein
MASTRDDTSRTTDISTGVPYGYADRYHPSGS